MKRNHLLVALFFVGYCGCVATNPDKEARFQNPDFSKIKYDQPAVSQSSQLTSFENTNTFPDASFDMAPLRDFDFEESANFQRLSLNDCIRSALENSPVIRNLGGVIIKTPASLSTIYDPALRYSDPRFGEESALSDFDAKLTNQVFFNKNDRIYNNEFIGRDGALTGKFANYRLGVSKQAATGGIFESNLVVDYDSNNNPVNRFNDGGINSHAYDAFVDIGFRQPLMQGAGVGFNRIAGPNNDVGVYNGIQIARANTEIALAEFETNVRDLISNVENAYWDLYYAYRDLEAKIEAREGAFKIWQSLEAQKVDTAALAQAKEQYYRFAADVQDAIIGRLNEGTRTFNGSASGTFRANSGVRVAERRLRFISGLPINGPQLVVPSDSPSEALILFDWQVSRDESLVLRPEIRRQRTVLERRKLELVASRNYLLPRVDLLGKYRVRGFGHQLFGNDPFSFSSPNDLNSSAMQTLVDGDLQEWELGLDVNVPIGYRRQNSAVRNAELGYARAAAVLREQERVIGMGLSNAFGELTRSTNVRDTSLDRLRAAEEQLAALQEQWDQQITTINLVLEAERRVIEAKLSFYRAQVEYMLAVKAVHFQKGTLFDYHNLALSELDNLGMNEQLADSRVYDVGFNYINNQLGSVETAEAVVADDAQLANPDQFLEESEDFVSTEAETISMEADTLEDSDRPNSTDAAAEKVGPVPPLGTTAPSALTEDLFSGAKFQDNQDPLPFTLQIGDVKAVTEGQMFELSDQQ